MTVSCPARNSLENEPSFVSFGPLDRKIRFEHRRACVRQQRDDWFDEALLWCDFDGTKRVKRLSKGFQSIRRVRLKAHGHHGPQGLRRRPWEVEETDVRLVERQRLRNSPHVICYTCVHFRVSVLEIQISTHKPKHAIRKLTIYKQKHHVDHGHATLSLFELRKNYNILLITNDHVETLKKMANNTITVYAIDRSTVQTVNRARLCNSSVFRWLLWVELVLTTLTSHMCFSSLCRQRFGTV